MNNAALDGAGPTPAQPPGSQQWMHDLRNAVNAIGISIAALEVALAREDRARALDFLARAQSASERCRTLLDTKSRPSDEQHARAPGMPTSMHGIDHGPASS